MTTSNADTVTPAYTVREIWEGELLSSRDFESEILAGAYYSSTTDRLRRSDDVDGITVQMIENDSDDVLYEQTF